jgi:hypothetical protein
MPKEGIAKVVTKKERHYGKPMTKSIIHFTRSAYKIAKKVLPPYSRKYFPHKYTQPQLFAILALCRFLDVDYRGIV